MHNFETLRQPFSVCLYCWIYGGSTCLSLVTKILAYLSLLRCRKHFARTKIKPIVANRKASIVLHYFNSGSGYAVGQKYLSCKGCMSYNCTFRSSDHQDGSNFKMFWMLETVAPQCCQDSEGKVFPPQSVVSKIPLGDKCGSVETAVCKTSSGPPGPVGSIKVSYTYNINECCMDSNAVHPVGTKVLEKKTCSARTCMKGRPAQWNRQTLYNG